MIIYGLKSCDTCRKALKTLGDAQFVDIRAQGVPPDLMRAAQERFGDVLLNRRSTTWRGLDADQRARAPLELMRDHPTLMKRPLIQVEGELFLGFGKDVQVALGLA